MQNKYTWVAFNLIASIGACLYVLFFKEVPRSTDGSLNITNSAALVLVAIYGGVVFWVYRSIIYSEALSIGVRAFKVTTQILIES
ncbi:hypothetical protein [Vibrio sp. TRT 29B02]|uniref:hypothetical protein n=1 Tax=Vibrio sp. TRT 29B02 TaxID=3418508 RepID=UPI003CF69318